ncbi:MBOAT family protein [Clostridium tertium]|jgi:alginate O-acetyltransferase complex protein AlgI|uniref:MBOAT family O-acyltransferase n=1 Tax=Clostridium TaxID=1485 RepID=UPI00232DA1D6|nr:MULTISPECIES: MBOAT family O-acyltransferase [Clostridium]MDB1948822.1 MBOAT family protein [Clostridium tertium]MDB1955038.1 MBOAT family protein [Clostridium tertium]MDB1958736.1 MBOAT family protein [Clostridium tertium]MDB1963029.1 MBOAT family protein [Clostridium tertium]MDB1966558.1 MBOAT family protein [Clostridium tertium]
MVFSSLIFIFRFLPVFIAVYYITPYKYKNLCILIFSLFFYSFGEPKYFPIMISSIIIDYIVSILIQRNFKNKAKCKVLLLVSIIFNMGILIYFKYANFFIENINLLFKSSIDKISLTLPLGISFYTFQTLSYTIDVYKGKVEAEKNIIDFGAFVSLFPQLIAGPIVKYSDINKEIKNRSINMSNFELGLEEFIIGLSKKVLIANNIGMLWSEISSKDLINISTPLAWLGIIAFSFQIYFDFSGYSSMAIGLGKMIGFNFPINFNFPYISRSITEFWRRWHITLGSWFKEYVYIPLGGNKVNKIRVFLNLLIVWFLTGFWHGAEYTFILWGLYFFTLIYIEKIFLGETLKRHVIFSHLYTIFFLIIGWCIFAITDISTLGIYINKMFTWDFKSDWIYYIRNYFIVIILCIISSTPLVLKIYNKMNKVIKSIIIVLLFMLSIAYLVDSSYNPFLYFRF